jgi:hypothetical protein
MADNSSSTDLLVLLILKSGERSSIEIRLEDLNLWLLSVKNKEIFMYNYTQYPYTIDTADIALTKIIRKNNIDAKIVLEKEQRYINSLEQLSMAYNSCLGRETVDSMYMEEPKERRPLKKYYYKVECSGCSTKYNIERTYKIKTYSCTKCGKNLRIDLEKGRVPVDFNSGFILR